MAGAQATALARLYDVDLLEDPGDLDFYLALAARAGRGNQILEIGVGTGRIAVPLAAEGYAVTGLDRDPAMLERAHELAASRGVHGAAQFRAVEGDARRPPPDLGRFRLAFVALNTLLVLGTRQEQEAAVRAIARHLEPDGVLAIDVWLPDAEDLGRYDGRLGLEYVRRDPETGNLVTKTASALHDAANATVDLTSIYDEGMPGEAARRWIRTDRLRLTGADDLRAFAEGAGLEVEMIAGDYDLSPLAPGSDRAILIARRPRAGRARTQRESTCAGTVRSDESPGGPSRGGTVGLV